MNRIKELRKLLGMTQEEFGQRIGVTRGSISHYESDKHNAEPIDRIIYTISAQFGVNPDWLKGGDPPIYLQPEVPELLLHQLQERYNLSSLDIEIIEAYITLSEDDRKGIRNFVKNILSK